MAPVLDGSQSSVSTTARTTDCHLHKLKMIRKCTLVGRSILLLRNSLWHDHQVVLTGFVNMLSTSAKNWVYCITSMLAVLGTT